MGNSRKTITATPRQLESMIRLSEAIAKMRLSETVEKHDIDEAVRLIKTAMQQSATDPMTGEIDMDLIALYIIYQYAYQEQSQSHASTERVNNVKLIVKKIYEDHKEKVMKTGLTYNNLYEYAIYNQINVVKKFTEQQGRRTNEKPVNEGELRQALTQLENEQVITTHGHMRAPTIRFIAVE